MPPCELVNGKAGASHNGNKTDIRARSARFTLQLDWRDRPAATLPALIASGHHWATFA
jgi:hypothetical protein